MTSDPNTTKLADRVRAWLADHDHDDVREKAMFGGRAFMVDDKLLVSAGGDDALLVRADPDRADELLAVEGARIAEMGERSMGPSWLNVDADAAASEEGLGFWLDVAIDYNTRLSAREGSSRKRKR